MEENIMENEHKDTSGDLYELTKEILKLDDIDIRNYSPLTLAYIGDGIYELIIRTLVVSKANTPVNKMHKKSASLVKAGTQSAMIEVLMEELTQEEIAVFKRGRNAKSATSAKNATIQDYRRATGLEALMGYLYLTGRSERMTRLIQMGLERLKEKGMIQY